MYNSVDPDQTTLLKDACSETPLLNVSEVLAFLLPNVKIVSDYDFVCLEGTYYV